MRSFLLQASLAAILGTATVPHSIGAPATIPVTPVDKSWTSETWEERHDRKLKEAAEGGYDLVLLGDSITHQWERSTNARTFLSESLKQLKILNLGYGGDRTQHVLWRLENGEVEGLSPKVVTLMIGTNNVAENTPEETAEGVKLICETLQKKLPNSKILLLAIFPRGETPEDKWRKRNDAVNKLISQLHDAEKIFFLDINDAFLDDDGNASKEIMPDFLHPSDKGREIWMDAMKPKLMELLR